MIQKSNGNNLGSMKVKYSLDTHLNISSFKESKNKLYTSLPHTNAWAPTSRTPLKGNLNPADQTNIVILFLSLPQLLYGSV